MYLLTGSIWSFFWTFVLISGMIYTIAVLLTQLVADQQRDAWQKNHHWQDEMSVAMNTYFGSLGTSALSLYQSVSGGLDWGEPLVPLMTKVSPSLAVIYALYVGFVTMVMLNLVTGVFVEGAQRLVRMDQESQLRREVHKLFKQWDGDEDAMITWQDVAAKVSAQGMQDFLKEVDIDARHAKQFYDLINAEQKDALSTDAFVRGGLKMRAPAKMFDLLAFRMELDDRTCFIEAQLRKIIKLIKHA